MGGSTAGPEQDGTLKPRQFRAMQAKLDAGAKNKAIDEVAKLAGLHATVRRKAEFKKIQALTDARVTMATFGEDNNGSLDFRGASSGMQPPGCLANGIDALPGRSLTPRPRNAISWVC